MPPKLAMMVLAVSQSGVRAELVYTVNTLARCANICAQLSGLTHFMLPLYCHFSRCFCALRSTFCYGADGGGWGGTPASPSRGGRRGPHPPPPCAECGLMPLFSRWVWRAQSGAQLGQNNNCLCRRHFVVALTRVGGAPRTQAPRAVGVAAPICHLLALNVDGSQPSAGGCGARNRVLN